jgi:hypothetical protein
MLYWLLYNNGQALEWMLTNYFKPESARIFINQPGSMVSHMIIVGQKYTLCLIAGTTNEIDLGNQFIHGLFPPQRVLNRISTNLVWWHKLDTVYHRLANMVPPGQDNVIVSGHSQGAALACLMNLVRAHTRPTQPEWAGLYMALPKPGNNATINVRISPNTCLLTNNNDPVPSVPPNADSDYWNGWLAGQRPDPEDWWVPLRRRYHYQLPNGQLFHSPFEDVVPDQFRAIFTTDPSGRTLRNWRSHLQEEYTRRILMRCPDCDAQFPPRVYEYMFGPVLPTFKFASGLAISGGYEFPGHQGFPSGLRLYAWGDYGIEKLPPPPSPGADCEHAGLIPFNTDVDGHIDGPEEQWWKFPSTAGNSYTLTVTFGGVTMTLCDFLSGSCSSLTDHCAFPGSGTCGYTEGGTTRTGFCHLNNPGIGGGVDYVIRVDEA